MKIDTKDDEVVELLRKESEEFRRLEREHRRLDEEVLRFNKRTFSSSEEEYARKRLQKLKLFAKDKMAEMIRAIRVKVLNN